MPTMLIKIPPTTKPIINGKGPPARAVQFAPWIKQPQPMIEPNATAQMAAGLRDFFNSVHSDRFIALAPFAESYLLNIVANCIGFSNGLDKNLAIARASAFTRAGTVQDNVDDFVLFFIADDDV